ncbi:cell motility mediator [Zopfochytrium polystomum]|nr:cell motility mediator [Zopfochytrium polystomum]
MSDHTRRQQQQQQPPVVARKAQHAGSWYSDDATALAALLDKWLNAAAYDEDKPPVPVRAIIAPHAGYSYSAKTAAYAYKHIEPNAADIIFILGPSHHVYLNGCAVTSCSEYETPLGNLQVNVEITTELRKTGQFSVMSLETDEDEHSIEMHLPILHRVMRSRNKPYSIVPILVGSINTSLEASYGKILAPYLMSPSNLFIISSDFCHWGSRFRFTPQKPPTPIHEYIESLDHDGMALIESMDATGFAAYLAKTKNTICGRHPIGVLLQAIAASKAELAKPNSKFYVKFVKYDQSSRVTNERESSVSYASAICCAPSI